MQIYKYNGLKIQGQVNGAWQDLATLSTGELTTGWNNWYNSGATLNTIFTAVRITHLSSTSPTNN